MAVVIEATIIPHFSFFENVRVFQEALREDLREIIPVELDVFEVHLRYPELLSQTGKPAISASYDWPYKKPAPCVINAVIMGRLCAFANFESAMEKCAEINVSANCGNGKTESLTEKRDPNGRFEFYKK